MSRLVSAMKASSNKVPLAGGAVTNKSSLSSVIDLFFLAGASRGKDISPFFARSFAEDEDLSLRLVQWLRDVRGGAGERAQFRNLFAWLIHNDLPSARAILHKIPEVGRWDDLLVAISTPLHAEAVALIGDALRAKNGLCAKWMPRKGAEAVALRNGLGLTPKQYRKLLVGLSNTVEQNMCSGDWEGIELKHIPSVAFARYKRALSKRIPDKFTGFINKVVKGEAKIHASAVYPYDIVRSLRNSFSQIERTAASEQWKSLPDYLAGTTERMLVVADTSGSMSGVNVSGSVTAMDVCVSLAMYLSERLAGPFKDAFITFSSNPDLQVLKGSLEDRVRQLQTARWEMSTDLGAAFKLILNTAVKNQLSEADLPTKVLIISDMEFNGSVVTGLTNFENIRKMYANAGYNVPQIVFWNVNGRSGNSPVTAKDRDVALVSGFSPSIVQAVLGAESLSPESVMLKALLNSRYDY